MSITKAWRRAALHATVIAQAIALAFVAESARPAAQEQQSIIRDQTERSLQSVQGQSRGATKAPRDALAAARDTQGGAVEKLSLSRDGQQLAILLADNSIEIVDTRSGAQQARLLDPLTRVRTAAISVDGLHTMTGGENGTVALWDSVKGNKLWSVQGHEGGTSIAIALPDGSMATGGADGRISVWSLESGKAETTFESKAAPVLSLAASRDGRYLVSGHADGRGIFWFRPSVKQIAALGNGGEPVVAVGFGSSGRPVTVAATGMVNIWTAGGDKLLRSFQGPPKIVDAAFSADGQYVALSGDSGASFYALGSGNLVREFKGPPGMGHRLVLDIGLLRLYMGGQDGIVRVVSLRTGASLAEIGESPTPAVPEATSTRANAAPATALAPPEPSSR